MGVGGINQPIDKLCFLEVLPTKHSAPAPNTSFIDWLLCAGQSQFACGRLISAILGFNRLNRSHLHTWRRRTIERGAYRRQLCVRVTQKHRTVTKNRGPSDSHRQNEPQPGPTQVIKVPRHRQHKPHTRKADYRMKPKHPRGPICDEMLELRLHSLPLGQGYLSSSSLPLLALPSKREGTHRRPPGVDMHRQSHGQKNDRQKHNACKELMSIHTVHPDSYVRVDIQR